MPDERTSPSGDWQTVYEKMEVDASPEGPVHPCPNCGRESERVFRRVFECDEHGAWTLDLDGNLHTGNKTETREAEPDPNHTMAD